MEKRDYRLVIDGKYNRKAIIQRAWIYVRNYNYSLNFAMRMSWADVAAGFMPVWRIDHVPK